MSECEDDACAGRLPVATFARRIEGTGTSIERNSDQSHDGEMLEFMRIIRGQEPIGIEPFLPPSIGETPSHQRIAIVPRWGDIEGEPPDADAELQGLRPENMEGIRMRLVELMGFEPTTP